MKKFLYQNVISEFQTYLDENLEDAIYFESLYIKYRNVEDDNLIYRSIIKKNIFDTNRVLNRKNTMLYSHEIRKLHKIRKYEDYTFDTLDHLEDGDILQERINSIQAINTICTLDKKYLFKEIQKESQSFPVSVKVSINNFDFKFNDDPFESLSDLLLLIYNERKNENLYFNFIRYYFSNQNIHELLIRNNKKPQKNESAFIIAILFVFLKNEKKAYDLKSAEHLISNLIKKLTTMIPTELNQKYNLIENILENLSKNKNYR